MKPTAAEEKRLPPALARAVQFLDEKVGWGRIGFVVSIVIIAFAANALYHVLRGVDVDEVIDALVAVPAHDVLLAALFVGGGYFTLTFYDLFALRTVGRHDVRYRTAALSAFTSYAVGHSVGASVVTGGAVRYRIYSAAGLDAVEVAKVCFIAGLTFWLGNITVLGIGIAIEPSSANAIDHLPSWLNRIFAILILVVLLLYIRWVWRRPRQLGHHGWSVTLPGGPLTLLQISIGMIDLGFCGLAMYVLLPAHPQIDVITVAVTFVAATLLGFASHSPGGLGVFDAAMLLGLWQFDKEQLVAGLLLFRLLYYIAPLLLALVVLGLREVILGVRSMRTPRTVTPSERALIDGNSGG